MFPYAPKLDYSAENPEADWLARWLLQMREQRESEDIQLVWLLPAELLGGGVKVARWLDMRVSEELASDCWTLRTEWVERPGRLLALAQPELNAETIAALREYPHAHPLVAYLLPRKRIADLREVIDRDQTKARQADAIKLSTCAIAGCLAETRSDDLSELRQHSHFELLSTDASLHAEVLRFDLGIGREDHGAG